jgi:hypothetical protein
MHRSRPDDNPRPRQRQCIERGAPSSSAVLSVSRECASRSLLLLLFPFFFAELLPSPGCSRVFLCIISPTHTFTFPRICIRPWL